MGPVGLDLSSARFRLQLAAVGALAAWISYRTWDYYGRPLTADDLRHASPARLALGLADPQMQNEVVARLVDSGPSGWRALARSLDDPKRAVRLAAARGLVELRVVELEPAIIASLDEPDAQVLDAKMAALATNGSRKALPTLAKYFVSDGPGGEHLGVSEATGAFAQLAASVGDPACLPALMSQRCLGSVQAAVATSDIDPQAARTFAAANWKAIPKRARIVLGFRLPGLAEEVGDSALGAFVRAASGPGGGFQGIDAAQLSALLATVQPGEMTVANPARPAVLEFLARRDVNRAALLSFENPDPRVASLIAAGDTTVSPDEACVRAINGDRQVPLPAPSLSLSYFLAAATRRDHAALPLLRGVVTQADSEPAYREAAVLALARISGQSEDLNLVYRFLLQNQKNWDMWNVESALSFPDGERLLRQAIGNMDVTRPEGQDFVRLLGSVPGMQKSEDLQRLVVSKCAEMPWERIKCLEPTWCRKFGDDDLKEKYAVLLGNHRYLGRIEDLVCFAQSGHPKIMDELKGTAGRGLIDEIVACIELAGEEPVDGDRLAFITGYAKDKRWRVREAVAYALRRLGTPEAAQALAPLAADTDPSVRATATGDAYVSHHFWISPRPHETPVSVPLPTTPGRGPTNFQRAHL